MSSPILELRNLKKTYGSGDRMVQAVHDVSLQIYPGEMLAFAGPSGSGKTTLLNLVGGIDEASEGEVFLDGIPLSSLKEKESADFRLNNIGFVFQSYNLIPVLTAQENVEFVLELQGVEKEKRKAMATQVLLDVGLENRLDHKPNQLSGGQQQRVAIARALVGKPKLILADEPTANLDSKTGEHLLELLKSLNEKYGITLLFSTHDPKVLERMSRVVKMLDGKVIEVVDQP